MSTAAMPAITAAMRTSARRMSADTFITSAARPTAVTVAVARPINSSVRARRLKRRLDVPGRDFNRGIRPTGIDATFRTGTRTTPHDRGTVVVRQPVPRSSVTLRNPLTCARRSGRRRSDACVLAMPRHTRPASRHLHMAYGRRLACNYHHGHGRDVLTTLNGPTSPRHLTVDPLTRGRQPDAA